MYEKYFSEFYVSEHELKEKIHSTIKTLTIYEPEKYPVSLIEDMNANKNTEEILENLFEHSELCISVIKSSNATVIEKLRMSAIGLDMLADECRLNHIITKMMFKAFSNITLFLRYIMAAKVLETKLGYELLYDSEEIGDVLNDSINGSIALDNSLIATRKAWEEIDRLCLIDIEGDLFKENVFDFETAVENYIKKNLISVSREKFGLLLAEGISLNFSRITKYVGDEDISPKEINELFDKISQQAKQRSNRRVGRTPGGARKRKGFSWGDQKKLEFYETIESLPKLKWKNDECDIWQFAYKLFESAGEESVKSHPQLKELPSDLFAEAQKEWRCFFESSENLKANAKPRMFLFRHALQILEFPEHYTFSTFQKHYETGRKLFLESNSHNEF